MAMRVPPQRFRELLLLAGILAVGFAVRSPLLTANLPVAVNVDERRGLQILHRLDGGAWNPEWFQYPTFYYYVTHLFLAPFPFESALYYGRLLNLIVGCLLAAATYWIAWQVYRTRWIALAAAGLTISSPILIHNASYISTDVLAAALSMLALLFLARFFESGRTREWLAAMILTGLAMSTKYTAVLVLLSYLAVELTSAGPTDARPSPPHRVLDASLPRWGLVSGMSVLGLLALAAAVAFPIDAVLGIVERAGGVDSRVDDSDLVFLRSIRIGAAYAGILLLAVGAAAWRFPRVARRFCTARPYAGIALAGLVFLLGSPFVLVSFEDFIYDVGIELRANTLGSDGAQWLAYFERYLRWESVLVLICFGVGCTAAMTKSAATRLLWMYLLLSYLAIGSAQRGYERYLTPLLPVIFIVAASGVWWVAHAADRLVARSGTVALVMFGATAAYEMFPTVSEVLSAASTRDSSYFAFVTVNQLRPRNVLVSGDAVPSIEWTLAGVNVRLLPRASLSDEGLLRKRLTPETIIAVDGIGNRALHRSVRDAVSPIWSDGNTMASDDRLYLYRPTSDICSPRC